MEIFDFMFMYPPMIITTLFFMIIAFFFGSINTAIIVTKIVTKGGNIKEMGSGNAGFTNVLRCVGKVPAIITIVCDFLKAVVAVLFTYFMFNIVFNSLAYFENYEWGVWLESETSQLRTVVMYLAGLACILGHMFPIYFKFKGGKGVVAAVGMIAVLDWRVFLCVLITFLIVFLFTRIISISSLVSAVLYGPYTFLITYFFTYKKYLGTPDRVSFQYVVVISVIALLAGIIVIIKHHENIVRLIHGEEKKITAKKK